MMRLVHSTIAVLVALLVTAALVSAGDAAVTPAVKNPERHTGFLADIKKMNGDIDLVFVGDSITDGWRGRGKATWQKDYAPLKALNLGISGDRTQHVLWRLQNGELDGYHAKLFVIMIGTNNRTDPAESVANGIQAIIKEIHAKQAQAKILLLAIFPRGEKANELRTKNEAVNAIIAKWDDGKNLRYLDIGPRFLAEDKVTLPKDIMADFLHPGAKGYEIWAEATAPLIKEMLGAK